MALHRPISTLLTREPATAPSRGLRAEAASADYITTLGRFSGRDPDTIRYVPGAVEVTRRDPVGTVVLAFCARPDHVTVLTHVAAARAAGNTVGVILTGPVTEEISRFCEDVEFAAGVRLIHRLRDDDRPWMAPSTRLMVAIITDVDVAAGTRMLAYSAHCGDDTALLRFYSRCSDFRVAIDTVAVPAARRVGPR